mmetsp:Transcript_36837/g.57506  ORF Transcript_36837/g.57506 Transcript_36837/m.57506 type:complete len:138 (-) Transcript_36837:501-914(-)
MKAVDCYYSLLKVARTASGHEIKRAYRDLALKYHPDRNAGCKDKAAIFTDLTKAYQILVDQKLRDAYDRRMGFGRRVNYEQQAARRSRGPGLYTAPPPPGQAGFNEAEWNAWHHGENATMDDPVQISYLTGFASGGR